MANPFEGCCVPAGLQGAWLRRNVQILKELFDAWLVAAGQTCAAGVAGDTSVPLSKEGSWVCCLVQGGYVQLSDHGIFDAYSMHRASQTGCSVDCSAPRYPVRSCSVSASMHRHPAHVTYTDEPSLQIIVCNKHVRQHCAAHMFESALRVLQETSPCFHEVHSKSLAQY